MPQQPITSFNYENIGVNIDITPRTHHDDDVSLALKLAVQSISGAGFGGLPTFGNREINTVIRLRDGETNMLAGLIRDDERRVAGRHPGLERPAARRPAVRAQRGPRRTQTDIILTLTPHIVRVLDLTETDLRAFRVGRESVTPVVELPTLHDLPRPGDRPAPDQPPPAAAGRRRQPAAPIAAPRRIRRRRRRACRGNARAIWHDADLAAVSSPFSVRRSSARADHAFLLVHSCFDTCAPSPRSRSTSVP